jgi:hypothetical protein
MTSSENQISHAVHERLSLTESVLFDRRCTGVLWRWIPYIQTENSEDIQGCFPPITLDSTGLPSEGKSFRNTSELELYDSPS